MYFNKKKCTVLFNKIRELRKVGKSAFPAPKLKI